MKMKKDFERYLVIVQKQMLDMDKAVQEASELFKEGKLSEDNVNFITMRYDIVKTNYDRLLYARHLYNLPPKWIVKITEFFMKVKTRLQFIGKEQEEENQEAIDDVQNLVDEVKGSEVEDETGNE